MILKLIKYFILLGSIIILHASCASNPAGSDGWRVPTFSEMNDDWRATSESGYFSAEGDFDNNGFQDSAKILIQKNGNGVQLLAYMAEGKDSPKVYLLDELVGNIYVHSMGVRRVAPGTYQTACGKGYWDCREDETPEISVERDMVEFFKYESASSFFYWDEEKKGFKRIWMSD